MIYCVCFAKQKYLLNCLFLLISVERRRRYNINDRIKELGTLLPKQNEEYYDIVRDVRQNKGSIFKASVDYIKILKRERERKIQIEEICKKHEQMSKKLLIKLQVSFSRLSIFIFIFHQEYEQWMAVWGCCRQCNTFS